MAPVVKRCRHCKLLNPDTAAFCDCGYDFAAERVDPAAELSVRRGDAQAPDDAARGLSPRGARFLSGAVLVVIGVVVSFALSGGGRFIVLTGFIGSGIGLMIAAMLGFPRHERHDQRDRSSS